MSEVSSKPTLQGRVAVITGASQALGFEIATQYVLAGASVVVSVRDKTALATSTESLVL